MKLTNYETSKKLKELGFKAEHDYCYDKKGEDQTQCWNVSHELSCWDGYDEELYYPAYDLEAVIDVLPSEIKSDHRNGEFEYGLKLDKWGVGYFEHRAKSIWQDKKDDETLVTTAARLLIKLTQEGVVNLKANKDD